MADFDAWLDKMVGAAEAVGEKKRKKHYDLENLKLDKQYGTSSTPFGPGYEEQKLKNAGAKDVATITAGPEYAKVKEGARQADMVQGRLGSEQKERERTERTGALLNKMDIEESTSKIKSGIDLLKKSGQAESLAAKVANPFTSMSINALKGQSLKSSDILDEKQWSAVAKSISDEHKKKRILQAY